MMRVVIMSIAAALCVVASACTSGSSQRQSGSSAAAEFLDRYLTDDGRVIRHDQGGDIVSEGQAYGMLIAEIAGRPDTVRRIWSWTSAHLRRPDGLLSWHTSGSGQVEGRQSAADADVLAAYALLRYQGSDADALHRDGGRVARAVLDGETSTLDGAPVLLAGPWAETTSPPTVNPSYWMPAVFAALARYTGDQRWQQASAKAVSLLAHLTDGGRSLPPDWARVSGGGLRPAPAPDGSTPIQYGLDAARIPLWFSTACERQARRLAAAWWDNVLSVGSRAADLALAPTGAPINQQTNPLPLMASAAAADASHDAAASSSLRKRARQQAHQVPTYYGDAWLALGGALLDRTLDPCQEAGSG